MTSAWVFGEVEIRPAERRVLRAGVPQALGGRAFDLLLALIERGEVLSKDELMRQVWPGLVVEENNLTVHMSALRKAIGSAAISTVPGRGYQFTAEVLALAEPIAAPMGNLPAQTTHFLGREADLAAVVALLGSARMVTVYPVFWLPLELSGYPLFLYNLIATHQPGSRLTWRSDCGFTLSLN